MSRTRTNKRIGNVQGKAHRALMWAKFQELGVISMIIKTQCPYCEQAFQYGFAMRGIMPDYQHVVTCPNCQKKIVKKIGKGFTKQIREEGTN